MVRIVVEPLRNFGISIYPTLPVSFGRDTKSNCPFNLVVVPRETNNPTQGVNVGLHNCEINHYCISPRMGCLEYSYLRPNNMVLGETNSEIRSPKPTVSFADVA